MPTNEELEIENKSLKLSLKLSLKFLINTIIVNAKK